MIKQFFISILFLSLLFPNEIEVVIVKDYYPTGILKSERTYKDDLLDGPYTYYRSNGTIYKQGSMKYLPPTYPGGKGQTVSFGPFKKYFYDGQLKIEGTYTDGPTNWETQIGIWKYYYGNGQLRVYNDNDNKTYKSYNRNGQIKEEGVLFGLQKPEKSYFENGQLQLEGTYKDGKEDGIWKQYHENGQLKQENTYKNGKLIDFKEY